MFEDLARQRADDERPGLDAVEDEAGVGRRVVQATPSSVFSTLALVSPLLRELKETRHQFDKPFVLDHTATTERFGVVPTAWSETLAASVRDVRFRR